VKTCRVRAKLLLFALLLLPALSPAIGILVPRLPEFAPIQLGHAEVQVTIKENVAATRVPHDFFNPNARQLEADFYFPIPRGANVTDLVLYINGKPMKGEVLEKEKAREIYEGIVRRLQDPALLEWVDYNLFKIRVFPVPPSGTQRVEIEFAQPLESDQGTFRYQFPLKPPRKGELVGQLGKPDVKFTVNLESQDAIRNVYSPSHSISSDLKDPHKVKVEVPEHTFGNGTGDFLLFYELSRKDVALSLLGYRPGVDAGYFSLMVSPSDLPSRTSATQQSEIPSDYTFVIDTSGSMLDDNKIEQARKALTYCVSQLRPADRLNLVRFSTEVEPLWEKPREATSQAVDQAKAWISSLQARGGTNISEALERALAPKPSDEVTSRVHTVIFITDGLPTVGTTRPEEILKKAVPAPEAKGSVRIFTFGVGNDVNTKLLDQLAEASRATSDYVRPGQDMEVIIGKFFDKISRPALTNVKLEIPGGEVFDMYPTDLPDLFYGTQLTVFGRYKKPGPTAIKLTGSIGERAIEHVFEKTLPESEGANQFVEKLWGTRKIAYLLDQIRKSGENKELKDEVITLAKKYGVVTPYTSYLVTEDSPVLAGRPAVAATRAPEPARRVRFYASDAIPAGAPASAGAPMLKSSRVEGEAQVRQAPAASAGSWNMAADSGASAVDTAQELKRMKEAQVAQPRPQEGARSAGGRSFTLQGDVWVDDQLQANQEATLQIRYLSNAWFELSRLDPRLREILALGEKVRFQLGGFIIEVGPEGADSIEDTYLQKIKASI